MKILVTGAAGFIGFHICLKLAKQGHDVYGIDNINDYYDPKLKYDRLNELGFNTVDVKLFKYEVQSSKFNSLRFSRIDLVDYESINNLFKIEQFEVICNLAAQAGVRYSIENPISYLKSNIVGFTNIAECCRIYNVKKIFYASSSSIYGERKKFPAKEDDCVNPNNFYSMSKKNNEDIALIYSHYYNIQFIGLRFFTIYGEWGRPDMLLIKYINAALNKKVFFLNNFGNHFRDFTYIKDVTKNLKLLLNKKFRKKNVILNVCSNKPINIIKVLTDLDKEFGRPIIKLRSKQNADVFKTHGCNKKLIKITKFKKFTNIKVGILNLIQWVKTNQNLIKSI